MSLLEGFKGQGPLEKINMPIVNQATHDAILDLDGGKWSSGFGWRDEGDYYLGNDATKCAYDNLHLFNMLINDYYRAKDLIKLRREQADIIGSISKLTASPDVREKE